MGILSAIERQVGWIAVVLLTAWMGSHARPDLWLQPTWPTGGDIASHLLYVGVFAEWFLEHGKISGWLPEVFAGFPALTYYFPLPFVLIALTSLAVGLPLAFKWMALLPSFLLPAAVCWSTGLLGWPWPARLLGATATVGFLINEASSIWGGNILAQFSGEFAYSWGLLLAVAYWGILGRLLRHGGLGWLLVAVVVEVATALSHGFAILAVGLGSWLYLVLSGGGWQSVRVLLGLHSLAFLLLGFWLIPLLENHAWTIPNDSIYPVEQWFREFWPSHFWWVLGGVPLLAVFLRREQVVRSALLPFLSMGLIGLVGVFLAPQLGLANVRFLPYLQLGLVIVLAGALGWWLHHGCRFHKTTPSSDRSHRLALTVALLVALLVAYHGERTIVKIPVWSFTYFTGYEGRTQWTVYQRLAKLLRGGLNAPRILFEHDPANHDLGSTRSLESLPFFGTRPVLEGLYMESAISAPFVYQVQAEFSSSPSGPLTRYPPRKGTLSAAIGHLRELGADTLIVRSAGMKGSLAADERFFKEAAIGPFLVLRLVGGTAPLVELLTVPLHSRDRGGWLDRAYNRFLVDHPYQEREVFTVAEQPLPQPVAACQGGTVRLERLERERLVLTTDRPGCPHLLRLSYHPKWRSLTGEPVYLVEPFFMLVFPQQQRLELGYFPDQADRFGWILTALGGILMGIMAVTLVWGRVQRFSGRVITPIKSWRGWHSSGSATTPRMVIGLLGVGVVVAWGWYRQSLGRNAYHSGHIQFDQQHYEKAAMLFDQSLGQRHGWFLRAEALFWAGLAWERLGRQEEAVRRYQHLLTEYPAGDFAPEALYRLLLMHHQRGERQAAEQVLARLASRYSASRWFKQGQEQLSGSVTQP